MGRRVGVMVVLLGLLVCVAALEGNGPRIVLKRRRP